MGAGGVVISEVFRLTAAVVRLEVSADLVAVLDIAGVLARVTMAAVEDQAVGTADSAVCFLLDVSRAAITWGEQGAAQVVDRWVAGTLMARPAAIVCSEAQRSTLEALCDAAADRGVIRRCFYSRAAAQAWLQQVAATCRVGSSRLAAADQWRAGTLQTRHPAPVDRGCRRSSEPAMQRGC